MAKSKAGKMAQGRVPEKLHKAFDAVVRLDGTQKQAAIGGALYLFINASESDRLAAIRKAEDARNGTAISKS